MADETITVRLSVVEAVALASAAENGTLDDAIDNIGWDARRKAAYRRAYDNLVRAMAGCRDVPVPPTQS